jgi:tetratricopeptide (TPR) repeat protein
MKGLARLIPALLLLAPYTARAQDAASCEPDQGSPQFVARAYLALSQAMAAINQDADPGTSLRETLRILSDPRARDRDRNLVGQQYTYGQTYILLLSSDTPEIVRRGEIGLQTDPEQTIDLVLAADSMFKAVVAAHPECATMIGEWRQHRPWLNLVNNAINALNSDKPDSAGYYARRALILDDRAPYAYTVLAVLAQNANRSDEALGLFQQALERAARDTIYDDVRVKTMGDVARLLTERAETAPAAQRAALAREAITAYEAFLNESDVDDIARGFGISQLASMYTLVGDSARMRNVYVKMLDNPQQYGERALLEAGVVATRANQMGDAVRLFAAVHATNPYQRDALYNLAAAYIGSDEHAKVFPVAENLTRLDPNNPDNYMLYAYAYSGLLNKTTDARLRQSYTDSLIKYNNLAEQMPVRVMVSEFTRLRESTRVGGTVENKGRTPRSYTVHVEILGSNGEVIATQETQVGPVGAGERSEFRVTFPTPGESVAGYRYRQLTS